MTEETKLPAFPVAFRKWEVFADIATYQHSGNTALILVDRYGNLQLRASVELNKGTLSPYDVYIKDYSENKGIFDALIAAGVIQDKGRTEKTGFTVARRAWLTPAFCEEFGIERGPETTEHKGAPRMKGEPGYDPDNDALVQQALQEEAIILDEPEAPPESPAAEDWQSPFAKNDESSEKND